MVVLVLIAAISAVIAVSVFFSTEGPFPRDANVLIATFGVGMAVLAAGLTLVPFRRGERWAALLLAVWPLFFVAHIAALATQLPDGIFFVLSLGAVILGRRAQSDAST